MYLLAMIDYLSRINDVPLCTNYNDIRSRKLEKLYFSAGIEVAYAATGDERIKERALAKMCIRDRYMSTFKHIN